MKRILIHLSSAPFGGLSTKEGLDLALVLATFEQHIDLAFSGDALALLRNDQQPQAIHGKHLHKLLASLEFYDIDTVLVREDELKTLAPDYQLWDGVTLISATDWQQKLHSYQHIIRF